MGDPSVKKPSMSVRAALIGPLGRSPRAPGTVATLIAGIPSAYLVGSLPVPFCIVLPALAFAYSIVVSQKAESELGRQDPQEVVIDELVGYLVTMAAVQPTLKNLFVGFLLFRIFDIWKPWPVNLFQSRLRGGFAIVMDDVAAGVYAMGLVWIIDRVWT